MSAIARQNRKDLFNHASDGFGSNLADFETGRACLKYLR